MHATPLLTAAGEGIDTPNEYVFAGPDRMCELEDMSRTMRDGRFRYMRHYHPDRSPMQDCATGPADTWRELRRLFNGEAGHRALGQRRSLLTPLQRSLVAPGKPQEELYDLQQDPHETRNLAGVTPNTPGLWPGSALQWPLEPGP